MHSSRVFLTFFLLRRYPPSSVLLARSIFVHWFIGFTSFSLSRSIVAACLLCLPPFTLRASCVGSISLPLRQVSASFSLSFSSSLFLLLPRPPFLYPSRSLTNPLSLSTRPLRSFLSFVPARRWLDTNDRKKESRDGNVVGRTERLYRRFVHADYRFHATRGRLLLPPLTPTCKPAMCTSLWKVSSFLSWQHAALSLR